MQPETNQSFLNIEIWREQMRLFKALAKKYGLAMIVLSLNNYIAPFIFLIPIMVADEMLGIGLMKEGTDLNYYTMMILNELCAYTLPLIILASMFKKERADFIPDRTYQPFFLEALLMFLASLAAGAAGTIVTNAINSVVDSIFGTGEIEKAFAGMEPQNGGQFAIYAFCICIVAPIVEEFLFRDILLKPLRAYGDFTAAVVSGLIFGLYHGNFDQFAYAALVGFFYSVIAIKYNSIAPTVFLHAMNNTVVTFGNDLKTAFKGVPEAAVIEDVCSLMVSFMMITGVAALLALLAQKAFRLHNHNDFVPEPHALVDFASTPWVIVGLAVMFVPFFA